VQHLPSAFSVPQHEPSELSDPPQQDPSEQDCSFIVQQLPSEHSSESCLPHLQGSSPHPQAHLPSTFSVPQQEEDPPQQDPSEQDCFSMPQQEPSEHLWAQQDPSFTSTPASLAMSLSAVERSISASLLEML
jgi:hypothetical protein